MRRRYRLINGELVEITDQPQSGLQIVPDIEPYKSMIDGSLITSRAKHKEHLKRHNCFEVGNETAKPQPIPDVAPQQRHELIRAQVDAVRHEDWNRMVKKELDRIRWNSRS